MSRNWHCESGSGTSGNFQEFAAIHIRFQHGLLLWFSIVRLLPQGGTCDA